MQKNKHDHKATNIIKALIFGAFMLMPFAAILSTTAYATFNDNAKDSFQSNLTESINTINGTNENQLMQDGQIINFTYEGTITSPYNSGNYGFSSITYDLNEMLGTDTEYIAFALYVNGNIRFININGGSRTLTKEQLPTTKFSYVVNNENGNEKSLYKFGLAQVITYRQQDLGNTFYYAAKQVEEQPLFAWTKETGTYQTFKLLTNGFENNDNFIPVVLTYMFMTTCIYLIIDIVIESAIWLTHMIAGNKE